MRNFVDDSRAHGSKDRSASGSERAIASRIDDRQGDLSSLGRNADRRQVSPRILDGGIHTGRDRARSQLATVGCAGSRSRKYMLCWAMATLKNRNCCETRLRLPGLQNLQSERAAIGCSNRDAVTGSTRSTGWRTTTRAHHRTTGVRHITTPACICTVTVLKEA